MPGSPGEAHCAIGPHTEIKHEDARWGVKVKAAYVLLNGWLGLTADYRLTFDDPLSHQGLFGVSVVMFPQAPAMTMTQEKDKWNLDCPRGSCAAMSEPYMGMIPWAGNVADPGSAAIDRDRCDDLHDPQSPFDGSSSLLRGTHPTHEQPVADYAPLN